MKSLHKLLQILPIEHSGRVEKALLCECEFVCLINMKKSVFFAPFSSNVPSNIQRLLESLTPIVPTKPIPKSRLYDLNGVQDPVYKGITEYFSLGDVWECYDEWSAYGAGTPVTLYKGEDAAQYFVPFLSSIQIYKRNSPATLRDGSGGSEYFSRSSSNNSNKTLCPTSGDSSTEHGNSLALKDNIASLYFQFDDACSPYWRVPLFDKINGFAQCYPGLMTLKSIDLLPASWMSVAWYPIYHIPSKGTVKDLSACFLTYHTLSSFFQGTADYVDEDIGKSNNQKYSDMLVGKASNRKSKDKETASHTIALHPFGLATYRLQGDVWLNKGLSDCQMVNNLYFAAGSWLKQLKVQNHDFEFFTKQTIKEAAVITR